MAPSLGLPSSASSLGGQSTQLCKGGAGQDSEQKPLRREGEMQQQHQEFISGLPKNRGIGCQRTKIRAFWRESEAPCKVEIKDVQLTALPRLITSE